MRTPSHAREVLARGAFDETTRRLRDAAMPAKTAIAIPAKVRVERVRVTETSSSWAEYFEWPPTGRTF